MDVRGKAIKPAPMVVPDIRKIAFNKFLIIPKWHRCFVGDLIFL